MTSLGTFTTLFVALLGLAACEEAKERAPLAPAERSQVIQQKTPASQPAAVTTPTPVATASTPPKPRRALCGGKLDDQGKNAPKRPISRMAAAGETEPTGDPAFTGGFTWVNFWASWCIPCREEIPRLKDWQQKLSNGGKSFRVHFISVDDDDRQLQKFLDEQPKAGIRSTYWLKEGKERDDWLSSAGVTFDPVLPIHLLVDAKGKIRCRIQGAVEDADFQDLQALLGG